MRELRAAAATFIPPPGACWKPWFGRELPGSHGLPARQRRDFVDKMITLAVHSARAEAAEFRVTPHTTAGVTSTGYPFAWAITWRGRSASWMLTNRTRLQRAIS